MSTETTTEQLHDGLDSLSDDNVDSTDSDIRYAAYGARLRTALRATTRYVAYTSDIGEAARPLVPPWLVTAAYGVSWCYLAGDVAFESYKAHHRGPSPIEAANFAEPTRIGIYAVQRSTFQAVASMGLPALTIHTVVKQAQKAFKNVQNPRIRTLGPTFTGLSLVPGLPFVFDHPVENATDRAFDWLRKKMIENKIGRPSPRKDEL